MNTTSQKPIEHYLLSYSAYVDDWDPEVGDTHVLLGQREILHDRIGELSREQYRTLWQVDERVLALAQARQTAENWDVRMLHQTADLIRRERAKAA